MKRNFLLIFALAVLSAWAQVPVIITAGQSNTDGRVTEELPEYIRENGYKYCHWCYGSYDRIQTNGFEPFWPRTAHVKHPKGWAYDAVFYYLLEQELQRDFYVIKWSLGGTAIDPGNPHSTNGLYWSAAPECLSQTSSTLTGGRSLLLSFIEEIDSCIDSQLSKLPEGFEIKAFLWHQGESDRQMSANYHDNLKNVVEYVRRHLVEKTGNPAYAALPFICGTVARSNRDYSPAIESTLWQLSKELPNLHVIDMSAAELQRDRLHFTAKSAEHLGREMFKVYKGLNAPRTPLMGWSSWNTYHVNISDSLIRRQAEALVETGLKDAGYNYINIDDGFFGHRDAEGNMQPHPKRFPNGMKEVADYIHSLGLRAGIYAEAGDNTCGSIYDNDANGIGAGLYGHEQQDMNLFLKDWGYDFIKIDYCGGRDLGLDEEERYRTIVDAIRRTGRTDVSINICRWAFPGTWARELARSWRISPDIRPRWSSLKGIIERNLYLSAYAGDGHFNDMDMLEIGRGMSASEDELHFAVWCLMSSPLLIGCDLTTLSDETLNLLKNKELIALNQDPLGLQAHVVKRDGDCYVLVKDIEELNGRKRAVAFLNMSDSAYNFSLPFEEIGLAGKIEVRDLLRHKNIGTFGDKRHKNIGTFGETVAPHSVLICTMEGDRIEPSRYEAEWAYLNRYEEVGRYKKPVTYAENPECSGGVYVRQLGGSAENYAEWRNVWSANGGRYEMTIHYLADKPRRLDIYINGEKRTVSTPAAQDVSTLTLPITLQKGANTIRMGNSYSWAPDIDKFDLRPHVDFRSKLSCDQVTVSPDGN